MDLANTNAEVAGLLTVFDGMKADEEIKKMVTGFPRAFCVLVLQTQYSANSGKFHSKYENYRVLVGNQAALDQAKAKLEEKVKGTFEVVLREQAI